MFSMRMKHSTHLLVLTLVILLFSLALAACGDGSASAKPIKAPIPTKIYTSDVYTLRYPASWRVTTDPSSNTQANFADLKGSDAFSIKVKSNNGLSKNSLMTQATNSLWGVMDSFKYTGAGSTITLSGEVCNQQAFDGYLRHGPRGTYNIIICQHQVSGSTLVLAYAFMYGAPRTQFSLDEQTYFRPMLTTFQFT